jgi:Ca2+-binding EF-hand superfamily protein
MADRSRFFVSCHKGLRLQGNFFSLHTSRTHAHSRRQRPASPQYEKMGGTLSKRLTEALAHPEAEEDARKVFTALDKDKSGALSFEEWARAADVFWAAIRGTGEERVRQELREHVAAHAPMLKNMMGKMGSQAVTMLAEENDKEEQRLPWVQRLFEQADKNKDNEVSFEEFLSFVRNEGAAAQRDHEQHLRELVAQNVEENNGNIALATQHGAVTKTLHVGGLSLDAEAIRHPNNNNN